MTYREPHPRQMAGNRRLLVTLLLITGLATGASDPAAAGAFYSLESIRLQVETFIADYPYQSPYPPRFALGALDSRLRLKACTEPLAVGFARPDREYGNTALLVKCPVAAGWKIHLPVRIDLYDDVIVAAKPLVKGQKIDESAFRFKKVNVSDLNNGYFVQPTALEELQARRNIDRGKVLSPANLAPRMLVRSGQRVTLLLELHGLSIKTTGKALQSASLGQPVRVRNSQSHKIVEGVVAGDGLVKVGI